MLTGSIVALITPMRADGSVNYEQLQALVEWHIANGTDAIVAVGTTGESATLSVDEHLKVVETVIKTANKRIPVVAGAGANNTREAIVLAQAAEKLGADYTLSVVPYYNKPSQEGMYQHFKTIAEAAANRFRNSRQRQAVTKGGEKTGEQQHEEGVPFQFGRRQHNKDDDQ